MAAAPPSTPPSSAYDKIYDVNSITHQIPIQLDLDKLNYHFSNPTPSAPHVLVAERVDSRESHNRNPPTCRNFLSGYCRFGTKCKFHHDTSSCGAIGSNSSLWMSQHTTGNKQSTNSLHNGPFSNTNVSSMNQAQLLNLAQAQQCILMQYRQAQQVNQAQRMLQAHEQQLGQSRFSMSNSGPSGFGPQVHQQAHLAQQPTTAPWSWSTTTSEFRRETNLSHAFGTLTVQDFGNAGWNMDTGLKRVWIL